MSNIVLVGAGNMGFAMLRRWSESGEHSFAVVEPNEALRERAAGIGVAAYASCDDLPADQSIDVLVLATKPQLVCNEIARYVPRFSEEPLVISVAAGVGLAAMSRSVGRSVAIVRAMPNTPAAIGQGMIVCCPNTGADSAAFRTLTEGLLSAVGRVAFVDHEKHMDAVTAVSGSGPAYVFHFIEALAEAGVQAGLEPDLAMLLARQTVVGAANLADQSSEQPATLRQQVTSPNGTTAAALEVLMSESEGLRPVMRKAVEAAARRSVELGQ